MTSIISIFFLLTSILLILFLYLGYFNDSTRNLIFAIFIVIILVYMVCLFLWHVKKKIKIGLSFLVLILSTIGSFIFFATNLCLFTYRDTAHLNFSDLASIEIVPFSSENNYYTEEFPYEMNKQKYVSPSGYLSFESHLYRVGVYEENYVFQYNVKIIKNKDFIINQKDTIFIYSYSADDTYLYPVDDFVLNVDQNYQQAVIPSYLGYNYVRYDFDSTSQIIEANYFFVSENTSNVQVIYFHNKNAFFDQLPFSNGVINRLPNNSYSIYADMPMTVKSNF